MRGSVALHSFSWGNVKTQAADDYRCSDRRLLLTETLQIGPESFRFIILPAIPLSLVKCPRISQARTKLIKSGKLGQEAGSM